MPLNLLTAKDERANLSKAERNELAGLVQRGLKGDEMGTAFEKHQTGTERSHNPLRGVARQR